MALFNTNTPSSTSQALKSHLSFYARQPLWQLTLSKFETYAIGRLTVLKKIDECKSRGYKPDQLEHEISEACKANLGGDLAKTSNPSDEMLEMDEMSHHILRLVFCQTEDKRKWFVNQELALFKYRLEQHKNSHKKMKDFFSKNGLNFEKELPRDMSEELRDDLFNTLRSQQKNNAVPYLELTKQFETASYYVVPFTQVPDLVAKRRVVLRRGNAYVSFENIISIVLTKFKIHLNKALAYAKRWLPNIMDDDRIEPILKHVSQHSYTGASYDPSAQNNASVISADDVDSLAKQSFPLCMRILHETLLRESHLRHGGRMQYGLFLKGLGLPLEEAMRFWQMSFSKKFSPEEFIKKYAYNIRHNYGKEGKRANYTPYSCQKIILGGSPGPGEFHGCPYKEWDVERLSAKLMSMGIGGNHREEIISKVRNKEYQLACRLEFEARHPEATPGEVGNHPNAYAQESRQYFAEKNGEVKDSRNNTPSKNPAGSPMMTPPSVGKKHSVVTPSSSEPSEGQHATPADVNTKRARTDEEVI